MRFNTSHVTLYQIISKLWSIIFDCFNTSHVTLYLGERACIFRISLVSIHLMLLFIQCVDAIKGGNYEFQYISCYSLSQTQSVDKDHRVPFQYISCYSLSCYTHRKVSRVCVSIHLMLLFISPAHTGRSPGTQFQYISCYSLSERRNKMQKKEIEFQYISCYSLSISSV